MIAAKHRQNKNKEIIISSFFMGVTFKVQSPVSTGLFYARCRKNLCIISAFN
jgi:hypothetical protein